MEATLVRKVRIHGLDTLRGVLVLAMVYYHATWDLVYLYGMDAPWFTSSVGHWYQQIVCSTFIFLSGYCVSLGRHLWKRGAQVFAFGAVISLVTVVFLPENQVLFGILTLMGSAMLLTAVAKPVLDKGDPMLGIALCVLAFLLLRHLQIGRIALLGIPLGILPQSWYATYFSTYLGLPFPGFFSTDYFPLLPWLPLFWAGYFTSRLGISLPSGEPSPFTAPLRWCGRHALPIYVLHQPIVYGLLWLVFQF